MKIGVILVTFNRLDKLKIALECYEKQTHKPEYIYVINNHSTDGTDAYLKEWLAGNGVCERLVLELPYNSGGAGGFHDGLEAGLKKDADWLWVADDDAYPEPDAFEKINDYYESLSKDEKNGIAALCSAVINNGKIHYAHRNHLNLSKFKCKFRESSPQEYEKKAFDIDVFSYVGTLISKTALLEQGLCEKEYFIYCDDQEHALRIRKAGRIVVLPESRVIHNTPGFDDKGIFWGMYYHARNNLLMMRKHFPNRYYLLKMTKAYVVKASILSKNDKKTRDLYKAAYKDAFHNKKGIHEIYKPGWKY